METDCNTRRDRAVRVRIEGRVQGVGFRAWVEQSAIALGLSGWVRNRRDGGVEACFAGSVADVSEMVRRCHAGPPAAIVAMVKVLDEPETSGAGFVVRPTI